MATPALTPQNYFATQLSAPITNTDTTIYLAALPTGNEGYLEIDEGSTGKEIIYYTSKGANFVTAPSVGAGRGVGGTVAGAHLLNATVKMKLAAEWWLALQSGAAITTGAITPEKLLTGAGTSWVWQSWTPTWTNLTVGNGSHVYAKYIKTGKTVFARVAFVLGTTSAIGTNPTFTLPVTSVDYAIGGSAQMRIGKGNVEDTGATNYLADVLWNSTTTAIVGVVNAASTIATTVQMTAAVPAALGAGDSISFEMFYEAA